VQQLAPSRVTFVITAWHKSSPEPLDGDEDAACADYIEQLLLGHTPDPTPYLMRVAASPTGQLFQSNMRPEYPVGDLAYCTDLDRFNFALPVVRAGSGQLVVRPSYL
jgi:2-phosphosulfolactate phosphatase